MVFEKVEAFTCQECVESFCLGIIRGHNDYLLSPECPFCGSKRLDAWNKVIPGWIVTNMCDRLKEELRECASNAYRIKKKRERKGERDWKAVSIFDKMEEAGYTVKRPKGPKEPI